MNFTLGFSFSLLFTALFSAVENGHVDKARTILESSDLDVNCVNGDGFTPLDVAVLTNHKSLAKMLLAFGAQEGNHCKYRCRFLFVRKTVGRIRPRWEKSKK